MGGGGGGSEGDSPITLISCEHALEEGAGVLVIHEVMKGTDEIIPQHGVSNGSQQFRVGGFRGGCLLAGQQTHLAGQSTPLRLLHCTTTTVVLQCTVYYV